MTIEDAVYALSTITTKDHAGIHFTARYPDEILEQLESDGLIEVDRPVHDVTGYPYERQYWTVRVTEEGQALVDGYPEYWDTSGA